MKSPKFSFSQTEIGKVITKTELQLRWKTLGKQLRKQVLLDVVEFKDIDKKISELARELVGQICAGSYRPAKPEHYLVEKSRGLCRQMTLCRPEDLLLLETLTHSLKKSLVDGRPSKNAFFEPDAQRFGRGQSKFGIDDYSATKSWKDFQQAIFAFSRERSFVVVTDVANFYDFISFGHLRNIISSICDVREEILDLLIFVLNEMAWSPDYMPRTEVGLPQMESNAPRVLANAMLYELDRVAESHAYGDYVRFMDDIDVGVDSIVKAKTTIRDIDLTLQSRQLRLNASKTKILSRSEAFDHFCIKENRFLDYCSERINRRPKGPHPALKKGLEKAYSIWRGARLEDSRFVRGNGDKIFKYAAKVGQQVNFSVPSDDLLAFIKLYPSMRLTGFAYLALKNHPNSEFYKIKKLFIDGSFVDDFSFVQMAKFCVHARFRADRRLEREMNELISFFVDLGTDYSIYAALLIGSKIMAPDDLVGIIESTQPNWKESYWLGRTVGGLTSVAGTGNSRAGDFERLIRGARNVAAEDLLEFHRHLQTRKSEALRLFNYAKATNRSFLQGIIHPKALIIRSMAANSSFAKEMLDIKKAHPAFIRDPFYRRWAI